MRNVVLDSVRIILKTYIEKSELQYSLLLRHNKVIVLEVLQNTYISKETF